MRNLLKITFFFALGGLLFTCSEDFLEVPPQAAFSEVTLQNRAGVESALIAAYSRMDGWANDWGNADPWGTSATNWVFAEVASDNTLTGSEPGDQPDVGLVEIFEWLPSNGMFRAKFNVGYDGVVRCNQTLSLLEATEDIDESNRARIRGEAVFLRAHYHFEMWRMFKNIPYFREGEDDFRRPNDRDIAPEIVADLQEAIDLLPESQNEIGRITKWGAKAYLGRMYLYLNDYTSAIPLLEEVEAGPFSLNPCYRDMFTTAGESGPEMIFSAQASVNDGSGGSDNGNFGDRLNFPHAGSPIGCCGFNQPTQNFVNAHRVDDNGLPLFDSFNDLDDNPPADMPVDPRLDWNVGRDGVPYLDWGVTHDVSFIRDAAYGSAYSDKKLKYSGPDQASSVGWSNRQLNPVNVPIIRYADVLLMLAECYAERNSGSDLADAQALVNRIRERAGNCAQGPNGGAVAIDDPGITYATYSVSPYPDGYFSDQETALEAILWERRIELSLEGHRFFDLVRKGIMVETMNAYFDVEETRRPFLEQAVAEEKNNLYPLPTEAIDLSNVDGLPTLRQNPGY